MKNNTKNNKSQTYNTVELESGETLELTESTTEYTLPKIANKIASGKPLNEIERQMAASTIRAWLKFTKSTGRPRKFESDAERYAFHNAKRRAK